MREFEQLRQTWDGRDTADPIGDFIDVGDQVVVGTSGVAQARVLKLPWS